MAVAGKAAPKAGDGTVEARTLRNYVGGAWRDADAGEWLDDRDPASGGILARVPLSTASEVEGRRTAD